MTCVKHKMFIAVTLRSSTITLLADIDFLFHAFRQVNGRVDIMELECYERLLLTTGYLLPLVYDKWNRKRIIMIQQRIDIFSK